MVLESLRKNQQWLMILIATLVIISFVWFFNRTELNKIGRDRVASMYGRSITMQETDRIRRLFELGLQLGLTTNLASGDFAGDQNYIWNGVVLRHEALRMGIVPTHEEIEEAVKRLPAFQTNGSYDGAKYATFLTDRIGSKGFGQKQVEEVVGMDLQVARIRHMLESVAVSSPAEVKAMYEEFNAKTEAQVTRLKLADFTGAVVVSDDDVKKVFEDPAKKESFKKDALRKVKYVKLELTEDEKKLAGPPRREALQKIADKMEALSQAMLESGANIDKIAAGLGLTEAMKESAEFDRETLSRLPEASITGFLQAASNLTQENPSSDVLQSADSFYFLTVSAWTPERGLTIEEARPGIVKQLQEQRGREALDAKVAESRPKIVEALKAGKTFGESCTAAGLKAEDFPTFSLTEPNFEAPDASKVVEASVELVEGQLSKALPTPEGATIVFLVRRLPADEKKFETQRDAMANSLRSRKRQIAMREWLRVGREAAGLEQFVDLRN